MENNNKEVEDKDDLKGAQTREHNVINLAEKETNSPLGGKDIVEYCGTVIREHDYTGSCTR